MIIDFSVKNFKSLQEETVFSLYAQENLDDARVSTVKLQNEEITLTNTAMIYGSNASGKSNLLEAMQCFRYFILNSTDMKLGEKIKYFEPFLLDLDSRDTYTTFAMEFIAQDKIRYKYEFSFDAKEIVSEELVFYPKKQEALLFRRDQNKYKWGSHLKGKKESISSETLGNTLFLSKAANSGQDMLAQLYLFFRKYIRFNMHIHSGPASYTTSLLREDNNGFKNRIVGFLQAADVGVHSVNVKKNDGDNENVFLPDNIPEQLKQKIMEDFLYRPQMSHEVYDKGELTGYQEFDLQDESTGTIKMYDLGGKIIEALDNGYTFIIDEIDSGLHAHMVKYIVDIFNDPEINTKNAQLICATHNVSLMDLVEFRRDQVWFAQKSKEGGTKLYSLDEFSKSEVRKNSPFGKWYLQGRFGAIQKVDKSVFLKSRTDA